VLKPSKAWKITVVVLPASKMDPDAIEAVTNGKTAQLSEAVGNSYVGWAPHNASEGMPVIRLGQPIS